MHGYFSLDLISSSMLTVFLEPRSRNTVPSPTENVRGQLSVQLRQLFIRRLLIDFLPGECEGITPRYFIFVSRLDIEICKGCECDGIQFATPSSYDYLPSSNKVCRRYSDKYLEYRRRLGNPESGFESETALYVRFVSDDTVHRKGFNVSFIAYSDIPAGKLSPNINNPRGALPYMSSIGMCRCEG